MNLEMSSARISRVDGTSSTLESMRIRGSHIRYVHMDPKLDVFKLVEDRKKRIADLHKEMRDNQNKRSTELSTALRKRKAEEDAAAHEDLPESDDPRHRARAPD